MTPRVHHAVVTRGASEVFATRPETGSARGQAGVLLVRRSITPIDIASCSKPTSSFPFHLEYAKLHLPRNMATMLGTSVPGGSSGPASSNKTFHSLCSLSLDATTEPAVPPEKGKRVAKRSRYYYRSNNNVRLRADEKYETKANRIAWKGLESGSTRP